MLPLLTVFSNWHYLVQYIHHQCMMHTMLLDIVGKNTIVPHKSGVIGCPEPVPRRPFTVGDRAKKYIPTIECYSLPEICSKSPTHLLIQPIHLNKTSRTATIATTIIQNLFGRLNLMSTESGSIFQCTVLTRILLSSNEALGNTRNSFQRRPRERIWGETRRSQERAFSLPGKISNQLRSHFSRRMPSIPEHTSLVECAIVLKIRSIRLLASTSYRSKSSTTILT